MMWKRVVCLLIGHRFAYKHGPLGLHALFYIGTPHFWTLTALHCERCGLEGTR
jgi:hypothetical protein